MLRRITLESLESRTLLDATLPAPTVVATSQMNITGDEGNDSSPTIAVDPHNPNKLAAVWVRERSQAGAGDHGFRGDGGLQRCREYLVGPHADTDHPEPEHERPDRALSRRRSTRVSPSTATTHIYVLTDQHTTDNSVGALVLDTYDFSGASLLCRWCRASAVYEWDGIDPALTPTMAVDDNVASFSDVNSIGQTVTQTDPTAGDVYVAWASNDTAYANSVGLGIQSEPDPDHRVVRWGKQLRRDHGPQQQRQRQSGQDDQPDDDDQPGACGTGRRDPRADRSRCHGDPRRSGDGRLRRYRLGGHRHAAVRHPVGQPGFGRRGPAVSGLRPAPSAMR